MKQLTLLILAAFIGSLTYGQHVNAIDPIDGKTLTKEDILGYNTSTYPDKAVQEYKKINDPGVWGGYLKIGVGVSPTHPRLFADASMGLIHRYGELSVNAFPGISSDGLMVFSSTLGYRQTVNKMFTVVPKIGYWTYWNQEEPIKWTGGNRFVYGVEINRRIHDNLEFSVNWMDFRGQRYNAMKIGTCGVRYIF